MAIVESQGVYSEASVSAFHYSERECVSLLFDRGIFEIPISETLAPFVYSNAPSSLYFGISILVSFYNVTVTRQNETSPFPIMPNKHRPTL